MTVTLQSGRRFNIPAHHPVFEPVGEYEPGTAVDPQTVDVEQDRVERLRPGRRIIIDNKVEVVSGVARS